MPPLSAVCLWGMMVKNSTILVSKTEIFIIVGTWNRISFTNLDYATAQSCKITFCLFSDCTSSRITIIFYDQQRSKLRPPRVYTHQTTFTYQQNCYIIRHERDIEATRAIHSRRSCTRIVRAYLLIRFPQSKR